MSNFCELKNREFYTKTLHILVPVMLQQLITVGINFFDNIMVGSFGEAQIAGAALGNQFYNIFQFVCMGLGSGAIVLSSQFWGSGERDRLKTVAAIALRLTFVLGAIFTAVSVLFPRFILGCYTNDVSVIDAGENYMRLIGCTFLFVGLSSSATYLLRSTGHVRAPLISSIGAFILNIFFNWVFIFGKFGMPRLEIVGAAVGTVIARTFEFCFVFGYFVFKDKNFGFRLKNFFLPGGELTRTYLRYGLPVLISDTLLGLGLSVNSVIIGHISAEFVAANSIVMTFNQMLTIINTSMGTASGVVVGNTIGTGDTDRAYREGVAYIVISVAIGTIISCVMLLFSENYLNIYTISAETRAVARTMFLCTILMSPVQTLAYVTSKGILRGGGDTRFLMVADIILLWAVSLPLGALAGFVWHMSPFWIYFFLRFEYGGKGLLCLYRFITKRWIRKIGAKQ